MKSALILLLGVCFVSCQFPVEEGQVKDHIEVVAKDGRSVEYDYEYTAVSSNLIEIIHSKLNNN